MKLINSDDIKYQMLYKENFLSGTGVEAPAVWKSDIDAMPAVDAVPVVRCKDCKFYWQNMKDNFDEPIPACLASPKVDAFCSEGERIENANNRGWILTYLQQRSKPNHNLSAADDDDIHQHYSYGDKQKD